MIAGEVAHQPLGAYRTWLMARHIEQATYLIGQVLVDCVTEVRDDILGR